MFLLQGLEINTNNLDFLCCQEGDYVAYLCLPRNFLPQSSANPRVQGWVNSCGGSTEVQSQLEALHKYLYLDRKVPLWASKLFQVGLKTTLAPLEQTSNKWQVELSQKFNFYLLLSQQIYLPAHLKLKEQLTGRIRWLGLRLNQK